jgi:hypothetical protein
VSLVESVPKVLEKHKLSVLVYLSLDNVTFDRRLLEGGGGGGGGGRVTGKGAYWGRVYREEGLLERRAYWREGLIGKGGLLERGLIGERGILESGRS